MIYIQCLVSIIVASCSEVHGLFHVEKSGILPVVKGDIIIEFFIAVANDANEELTIMVTGEPKCCWTVTPGDIDCESMTLFGKDEIIVPIGKVLNFSYLFPNKYPMNRKGDCTFNLQSKSQVRVHKVSFDTHEDLASTWIPGIGYSGKVKICPSVDKDPYDNCDPVDCAHKYSGKRSFYNSRLARCEKAAWCLTKRDNDDLPISAFDQDFNRCKSLIMGPLKDSDKKMLRKGSEELSGLGDLYEAVEDPSKLKLDCNNGRQEGAHCVCDAGYITDRKKDKHGFLHVEWCNKKLSPLGSPFVVYYIFVMGILGLLTALSLVSTSYFMWVLFVKKMSYPINCAMESLILAHSGSDSESEEVCN